MQIPVPPKGEIRDRDGKVFENESRDNHTRVLQELEDDIITRLNTVQQGYNRRYNVQKAERPKVQMTDQTEQSPTTFKHFIERTVFCCFEALAGSFQSLLSVESVRF